MASGIEINNRSVKGVSRLSLKRLGDGLIYNLPSPMNVAINQGVEQRVQGGRSDTGLMVNLFSYKTGEKPTLTTSFGHYNPELIALRVGNQIETTTIDEYYPLMVWVKKGEYAGASTGKLGFGIAEDVGLSATIKPQASIKEINQSEMLTQEAFASYSSWRSSNKRFAVGANGALAFSDDIVAAQHVVTLLLPMTGAGTRISELSAGAHEVRALVVDNLDDVHLLVVPSCTLDLSGASLDFSAESLELVWFLNSPPGSCKTWNLYSPIANRGVACVAG
jgi:hypothetical protein